LVQILDQRKLHSEQWHLYEGKGMYTIAI